MRPLPTAVRRPITALAGCAGSTRYSDRGVPLDRETQGVLRLARLLSSDPPGGVEAYRRETEHNAWLAGPAVPDGVIVSDHILADRLAWLYEPPDARGILLYVHGGGFVVGSLASHHGICGALAARAGCRVLSVDYRLAPEHPWPAAPEDILAAWSALRDAPERFGNADDRLVMSGDSAGGNLSVLTAMACRDRGLQQPDHAVLLYPGLEFTRSMPSHRTFADGFFLTEALIGWFTDHYLSSSGPQSGSALAKEPGVSPWWTESLAGLCPMTVITAGFDPLRDEGDAFAARLADAGVPVTHRCEEDLIHGFANLAGVSRRCDAALSRAAVDIKNALR